MIILNGLEKNPATGNRQQENCLAVVQVVWSYGVLKNDFETKD